MLIMFVISVALISGCGSTAYKDKKLENTNRELTWWDRPEVQRVMYGTPTYISPSTYSPPSTYSNNNSGFTSGNVGGENVNLYNNGLGFTSGNVGSENVNLYNNGLGFTSGNVGGKNVNCYTNSFGYTTCN